MKMEINNRHRGYLCLLRAIALIFMDPSLDFQHFGSYIAFILQADWDIRHKNFGILPTDSELSLIWNINASTVSRNRRKLVRKGLIEEKNERYYIKYLEAFFPTYINLLAKEHYANKQNILAKLQELDAKMQEMRAELQDDQLQNGGQSSRFTSKGDIGSSGIEGVPEDIL